MVNHGLTVVPFKAQNMSNNAAIAVTADGGWGEIGTAQEVQARACRQPPRVEMNPVLLKSGGLGRVQVVVEGVVAAVEPWTAYSDRHALLFEKVLSCHRRLVELTHADVVVIEGAGSCVELNLLERDIVNLPLVRRLGVPWILVCDVDRGGVFAQALGVRACLDSKDWQSCVGVIANRLRGDPALFADGRRMLEDRLHRPVWLIPHLDRLGLPDEDGVAVEQRLRRRPPPDPLRRTAVVPAYPHLSIASDVTAVENDPSWRVEWWEQPPDYVRVDAVLLPGSKLTRSDLEWLHHSGWSDWIRAAAEGGAHVVGVCGGYQMLGIQVDDPQGIEGSPGTSEGLGLLPITTVIQRSKQVRRRVGRMENELVEGFEIHCGVTQRLGGEALLEWDDGSSDGCRMEKIAGSYLHGMLDLPSGRRALLGQGEAPTDGDPYERLAAHLAEWGLDGERLAGLAGIFG